MIIPLAVDVPEDRWPVANWSIIAVCGIVFACQVFAATDANFGFMQPLVLDGFSLGGLFGHIWLHANPLHLILNMLFLWVLGNAVCAKVGNMRFLRLYLLFGLVSGLFHLAYSDGQVIGASGAINGVAGAFVVLFPRNTISCLFLPLPGRFTLAGWWIVLFWLISDLAGVLAGGSGIAYWAHLGGIAAGYTSAVVMLKLGLITMERYEESLLDLFKAERISIAAADDSSAPGCELAKESAAAPQARPARMSGSRMIRFACGCGREIRVTGKYAGQSGKCPVCKSKITVPNE